MKIFIQLKNRTFWDAWNQRYRLRCSTGERVSGSVYLLRRAGQEEPYGSFLAAGLLGKRQKGNFIKMRRLKFKDKTQYAIKVFLLNLSAFVPPHNSCTTRKSCVVLCIEKEVMLLSLPNKKLELETAF